MATLPTLYPNGDGTQNGITSTGTPNWQQIDDWTGGGAVDGDTTYISSGIDLGGDGNFLLTDMPADFDQLDSLSIDTHLARNGTVTDDTMTLTVGIVGADGSTVLAAQKQIATQATGTTYTTVTASWTSGELASRTDKAVWDGAQLRYVWTYTKNKSSDGISLRVTAARVNGTYTQGAVSQSLTGTLFTKAPAFGTGAVTPGAVALAGTTFARSPTFGTGTVAEPAEPELQLSGFRIDITYTATTAELLDGILFTKAPTFPTGSITTGAVALSGATFTKAPTFEAGTVAAGATALTGTLFTSAPDFGLGAVTPGAVTVAGVTFTRAPTFPQGVVAPGAVALTGTTFVIAPSFGVGAITESKALTGVLFTSIPSFGVGVVTPGEVTLTGTTLVKTPAFGAGTIAPGAAPLTGLTFAAAPTFNGGVVSAGGTILTGTLFTVVPTFPLRGTIGPIADLEWYGTTPADGTVYTEKQTDIWQARFTPPSPVSGAEYRFVRLRGITVDRWDWDGSVENWRGEFNTTISSPVGRGLIVEVDADGVNSAFESVPGRTLTDLQNHAVPVVEGRAYTLMYRWKLLAGSTPDNDVTLNARFYWYDSSGAFVGQEALSMSADDYEYPNVGEFWQANYSISEPVAPAGATYMIVNMYLSTTMNIGDQVELDEMVVVEEASVAVEPLQSANQTYDSWSDSIFQFGSTFTTREHETDYLEALTGPIPADFEVHMIAEFQVSNSGPNILNRIATPIRSIKPSDVQPLTGTLFTQAPTFPTGEVASEGFLAGTVFQSAPAFDTGAIIPGAVALTGTTFERAPAFGVGSVEVGVVSLTGTTFTSAPSFGVGIVTGAELVSGVLFDAAPTFFTGTVTTGEVTLTGTTFTSAPTFQSGVVVLGTDQAVVGALFTEAPTFFSGLITQAPAAQTVVGETFVVDAFFPTGQIVAPSIVDQRPWEFAYFTRDNQGNLRYIIREPQVRIRPGGSKVSDVFRWNVNFASREYIDQAISSAWEANKAADVPTLKAALNAALDAVGIRARNGSSLV